MKLFGITPAQITGVLESFSNGRTVSQVIENGRRFEVVAVAEDPPEPPQADLHVHHLGNSPAHAFVYRAALAHPGVVVLHDWNLHHLVLRVSLIHPSTSVRS